MTLMQCTVFFFEVGDEYPMALLEEMYVDENSDASEYAELREEEEVPEGMLRVSMSDDAVIVKPCVAAIRMGSMAPNFHRSKLSSYDDLCIHSGVEYYVNEAADDSEILEYAIEAAKQKREKIIAENEEKNKQKKSWQDKELKTPKVVNIVSAWEYHASQDYFGEWDCYIFPKGVVDLDAIVFEEEEQVGFEN